MKELSEEYEYLIKWETYSIKESTWETYPNIPNNLIENFDNVATA